MYVSRKCCFLHVGDEPISRQQSEVDEYNRTTTDCADARCAKQDEHNAASGATNKQLGITSESQSDATPSVVIIKVDVFCPNH